jgi:hypothetical protein
MSRVIALLLAATIVFSSSRANADLQTLALSSLDRSTLEGKWQRAVRGRNLGIALSIPGIALNIIGAVLLCYGVTDDHLLSKGNEIVWGAIISGLGLGLAVPGVVLWILEQDRMDVLAWRRRQLTSTSIRPLLGAYSRGALFGVSVTF